MKRFISEAEIRKRDAWVKEFLSGNVPRLPFSFVYGDKRAPEDLQAWGFNKTELASGSDRASYELSWSDPHSALIARCTVTVYKEYPAVDWTAYIKNGGEADTPLIWNFYGMDAGFGKDSADTSQFIINTIRSDVGNATSYQPMKINLSELRSYKTPPVCGVPAAKAISAAPFFNISWSGQAVMASVGWPGNWFAEFSCTRDNIRIIGGQEGLRACLRPGEEIRSCQSLLMFIEGEGFKPQNVWRRFMYDCILPRPGGERHKPMSSICMGLQQSEQTETEAIGNYQSHGFKHDIWWMDAGWYPCDGLWYKVGEWEYDKTRFPNGLRHISDIAREKGMKYMLWFECERVYYQESWLWKERPQWLIDPSPLEDYWLVSNSKILDLGNPDALAWLIAHISRCIDEFGVDIYRQDFNVDALLYWRTKEEPGRLGMTENFYVQGLIRLFDSILDNHPGIAFDSSLNAYGRRFNLETFRRSVPYCKSDYHQPMPQFANDPGITSGSQGHTYGIAQWMPYYGNGCFYEDRYAFLSHMSPLQGIGYNHNDEEKSSSVDWDRLKDTQRIWREVADNFWGDFYQLTEYSLSENVWMAWQFDRPEEGEGFVQAFRRTEAPESAMCFKLHGLDHDAVYGIIDVQTNETATASGIALTETGLDISLPESRTAALILYRKNRARRSQSASDDINKR